MHIQQLHNQDGLQELQGGVVCMQGWKKSGMPSAVRIHKIKKSVNADDIKLQVTKIVQIVQVNCQCCTNNSTFLDFSSRLRINLTGSYYELIVSCK